MCVPRERACVRARVRTRGARARGFVTGYVTKTGYWSRDLVRDQVTCIAVGRSGERDVLCSGRCVCVCARAHARMCDVMSMIQCSQVRK